MCDLTSPQLEHRVCVKPRRLVCGITRHHAAAWAEARGFAAGSVAGVRPEAQARPPLSVKQND